MSPSTLWNPGVAIWPAFRGCVCALAASTVEKYPCNYRANKSFLWKGSTKEYQWHITRKAGRERWRRRPHSILLWKGWMTEQNSNPAPVRMFSDDFVSVTYTLNLCCLVFGAEKLVFVILRWRFHNSMQSWLDHLWHYLVNSVFVLCICIIICIILYYF